MMTAEDCYRKAKEWLGEAQTATDVTTIASMRRACAAWIAQGKQIEEAALRGPQSPIPLRRPADMARGIYHADSVEVGDVLRDRLHLGDESSE